MMSADGRVFAGDYGGAGFRATFADETTAYDHGVLGDAVEYRTLVVRPIGFQHVAETSGIDLSAVPSIGAFSITLPEGRVFEDLQPRPYIANSFFAVVESDEAKGAQLSVYEADCLGIRKRAATPHIGRRYRWLAPAGIADFDGIDAPDIAYVETPHLGKTLKIVTLKGDQLVPIAEPRAGFSNHKIGQDFITSGTRQCEGRTELLTPNADWTALMAVRIEGGQIVSEETAFEPSLDGIAKAQRCD